MNTIRKVIGIAMSIIALTGILSGCAQAPTTPELDQRNYNCVSNYQPRVNFGQKFEPKGNYILHGAGQAQHGIMETFNRYVQTVGSDRTPCITMGYASPHHNYVDWASVMQKGIEAYGDEKYLFLQVGVHFNKDENPDECYYDQIASGAMDDNVKSLIWVLKDFKRPIFCRAGFEFNGEWNGYKDPEIYRAAFIRFAELVKECEADNIALVWCYNPDAAEKDYMKYYPGDEYVDWWAIDIFRAGSMGAENTKAFLEEAAFHEKPVMLGECTPYLYDVTKGEGWDEWFKTFFDFIRENPVIKAICYINWEWGQYPQWSNWGDARLEEAPEDFAERYRQELSDPVYFHATDKETSIDALYGCRDYQK